MRDKHLFIIILILSVSRFYDLGVMEVRGWDEALYAMRARSILQFGDWLDQSAHSIGGLYSAAHPPLYIWLTALTMKFLGDSGLAIRLWSAIFGAATILVLYFLPRDRSSGFFAAFILATSAFFGFYTRQGQLDVIYTFFIILGVFFYSRYETSGTGRWLGLTGLALGFALLSKIIVGFFLLMIVCLYSILRVILKEMTVKKALGQCLVVFVIGMIIALPWHLYMFWRHGQDFIDCYFLFHIIQRSIKGVELNVRALGPLFFANQIIVILSAGAAIALWRISKIKFREEKLSSLYFMSFLIPFVIFSLSRTQLRTYAIPMLPPLALLAGCGLNEIWRSNRVSRPAFSFTLVCSVWASSQSLRDSVKQLLSMSRFDPDLLILAVIVVITIVLVGRRIPGKVFSAVILGFLLAMSFTSPVEHSRSRIEEIAERFDREGCHRLIYIDEVRIVHNPQISYYFKGIDLGWRDGYSFQLIQPNNTHEIDLSTTDCTFIIVSQHYKRPEFLEVENMLRRRAESVMINDRYHVYRWEPTIGE